jgi:circadian clock protein KaiB
MKEKNKIKNSAEELNMAISCLNKESYVLCLYITGSTSRSESAIKNLKKICEEYLEGGYDLEVIDLYQKPSLAKDNQIIAAPTLIKKSPLPLRRIIGDMSDKKKVLLGLDFKEKKEKYDLQKKLKQVI